MVVQLVDSFTEAVQFSALVVHLRLHNHLPVQCFSLSARSDHLYLISACFASDVWVLNTWVILLTRESRFLFSPLTCFLTHPCRRQPVKCKDQARPRVLTMLCDFYSNCILINISCSSLSGKQQVTSSAPPPPTSFPGWTNKSLSYSRLLRTTQKNEQTVKLFSEWEERVRVNGFLVQSGGPLWLKWLKTGLLGKWVKPTQVKMNQVSPSLLRTCHTYSHSHTWKRQWTGENCSLKC